VQVILAQFKHLMKKSTNLIYYDAGCYGTFIEWCCNYFSININTIDSPFEKSGSSHGFTGNFLEPAEKVKDYLESKKNYSYVRCHPNLFEKPNSNKISHNMSCYNISKTDLLYLENNFKKILILHPSTSTSLWHENNSEKFYISDDCFKKNYKPYGYTKESLSLNMTNDIMLRFKFVVGKELNLANIQGWNKNNIMDFDTWDLRELLSFYWFNRTKDRYTCWDKLKTDFSKLKFVCIDDIKNNFQKTIAECLEYFEVDIDLSKLSLLGEVENNWRSKQHHINKDNLINNIINNLINKQDLDWTNEPITLLDEAYIQKCLADNGIQIKCQDLNIFPTNVKDFLPLLEYTK